jgi:hypothetical protein
MGELRGAVSRMERDERYRVATAVSPLDWTEEQGRAMATWRETMRLLAEEEDRERDAAGTAGWRGTGEEQARHGAKRHCCIRRAGAIIRSRHDNIAHIARSLAADGMSMDAVCATLGVDRDIVALALTRTGDA